MHFVKKASSAGAYRLFLTFEDGDQRLVDLEPHLSGAIFEPLKDLTYFKRFRVNEDLDTVVGERRGLLTRLPARDRPAGLGSDPRGRPLAARPAPPDPPLATRRSSLGNGPTANDAKTAKTRKRVTTDERRWTQMTRSVILNESDESKGLSGLAADSGPPPSIRHSPHDNSSYHANTRLRICKFPIIS